MPAANVRTFEKSYTLRVQSETGAYNAIVIPAKKGPVMEPVLVSGESQLLETFTPRGKVEVGYNMAYYSALAVLQKTDKLWVVRVTNEAEYGGAFVYDEAHDPAYKQINEIAPEKKRIEFTAENLVDGSDEITISNIQGGTADELNGRTINIEGVGTYEVQLVTGSTAKLTTPVTASVSFVGTGTGKVDASADYIGFDVDYGAGGGTNTVIVSNLTSGTPDLLSGKELTFVADGITFKRVVVSVSGSTLTLDANTPSVTNQYGAGFAGFPEVNADVSGIADGESVITLSNIDPVYITTADLDGRTMVITAAMSDGSELILSSTLINPNGSQIEFEGGFNNPSLVDTAPAIAPYEEAIADGIIDPSAVTMDAEALFSLYSADPGDWAKNIRIEIISKDQKTPGTFTLNIYDKDNTNVALETFVLSRIPGHRDGYGRNVFLEDALEASKYVRGTVNPAIDENVLPAETVTRDADGNIIAKSFIKFAAGDDGDAVSDTNMIQAADLFANKNSYPLTVFLDGGWSSPAYQRRITEICENRDDAISILSVPYEVENHAVTYAHDIVEYRREILNVNSSYGGLFTPHVSITDKFNDREIFVSPDGYAAAAINYSKANYEIWYPPAGFRRGRLFVNGVKIKFTDGDLDYLQDNQVNPIRFLPGRGIAIWGQRTLGETPSAFDRMNVRLLLNEIKPAITAFLENYLFELNTKEVRAVIKVKLEDYLRGIQSRNGIESFRVVCDDTNNTEYDRENHVLNVDVWIKPVYSIEFINFTTILSSSGIEFEIK